MYFFLETQLSGCWWLIWSCSMITKLNAAPRLLFRKSKLLSHNLCITCTIQSWYFSMLIHRQIYCKFCKTGKSNLDSVLEKKRCGSLTVQLPSSWLSWACNQWNLVLGSMTSSSSVQLAAFTFSHYYEKVKDINNDRKMRLACFISYLAWGLLSFKLNEGLKLQYKMKVRWIILFYCKNYQNHLL